MTGRVLTFPQMSVERAREIVAFPDLHGRASIVAACVVLLELGNPEDVQQVLGLQKAGMVVGFEAAARAKIRRERRVKLLGLYVLISSVIGTGVLASWIFTLIKAVLS